MGFEKLKGQDSIIKVLRSGLRDDTLGHAVLLDGPPGSGKRTLALLLAQALNCRENKDDPCEKCNSCRRVSLNLHPNVEIIEPADRWIKIEQIRRARKNFQYYTREQGVRVCIIIDAHCFTPEAAASMLKILEESPDKLVFVLTTPFFYRLPPTVRSRCRLFRMKRMGYEDLSSLLKDLNICSDEEEVEAAVKFSGGVPGRALDLLNGENWTERKQKVFDFGGRLIDGATERELISEAGNWVEKKDLLQALELLMVFLRDGMVWGLTRNSHVLIEPAFESFWKARPACPALLEECLEVVINAQGALNTNANARLVLETMFLSIQGRMQYA